MNSLKARKLYLCLYLYSNEACRGGYLDILASFSMLLLPTYGNEFRHVSI